MSKGIDLGDDSGFVDVTIGPVTCRLDLFCVWQEVADASSLPPREFTAAVQRLLSSRGFPEPSGLAAERFADAVMGWLRTQKKSGGGPGGSPASPESTAATSAA